MRERGGSRPIELAWAVAAGAIATAVAAWVLRLWEWSPSRPLGYFSDSLYYLGVVKGTLENGWFLDNPNLGAPFGLDSHDFPVVSNDALQLIIVKLLGIFFSSAFTVTNAFLLLTFPLAAMTAYWVVRRVGGTRGPALVVAVLFAIQPYHFLKLTDQLFFSSYYLVPLSCWLAVKVLGGDPIFVASADRAGPRRWLNRRTALVLGLCAAIASAGVYYAVFTCVLVGTGAALRALSDRRGRALATGAVVVAAIGAVAALEQIPSVLYRLDHGPNPEVALRTGADTEYFALKLNQLVFPVYGHRIEPLAEFTDEYRTTTRMLGEPAGYLGLLGTVGLAWLLLVGVASVVRAGSGTQLGRPVERHAAAATLIAFVFGTAGGLSAVIGYTLTAQIRTWSRMSIFIAFFALLAVALILGRLEDRARGRSARPVVAVGLALVLAFGAWEQTSERNAPDHARLEALYRSDAGFVHAIERRLGPGAMVLQLPYASFPENPRYWGYGDYAQMRAYLHSSALKWSYGAMKGRPADWQAQLDQVPLESVVAGAAAAGFAGVWVARDAYGDRAAALEAALSALVGPPTLASAAADLSFFDLRTYARTLDAGRRAAMADATLRPVRVTYGEGFHGLEGLGADRWRWAGARSVIELESPRSRAMVMDVLVRTDTDVAGTATFRFPDGRSRRVPVTREGTRLRHEFTVPRGASSIAVEADGAPVPDPTRQLLVQLRHAVFVPAALCLPAAGRGTPACTQRERPHPR